MELGLDSLRAAPGEASPSPESGAAGSGHDAELNRAAAVAADNAIQSEMQAAHQARKEENARRQAAISQDWNFVEDLAKAKQACLSLAGHLWLPPEIRNALTVCADSSSALDVALDGFKRRMLAESNKQMAADAAAAAATPATQTEVTPNPPPA